MTNALRVEEVRERWTAREQEWRRLRIHVDGAELAKEVLADLEAIEKSSEGEALTLTQAAELTGYSTDHLGRMVRKGLLRNVGRKGSPRVLAGDLPRRARQIAGSIGRPYDADADARSLRARR